MLSYCHKGTILSEVLAASSAPAREQLCPALSPQHHEEEQEAERGSGQGTHLSTLAAKQRQKSLDLQHRDWPTSGPSAADISDFLTLLNDPTSAKDMETFSPASNDKSIWRAAKNDSEWSELSQHQKTRITRLPVLCPFCRKRAARSQLSLPSRLRGRRTLVVCFAAGKAE